MKKFLFSLLAVTFVAALNLIPNTLVSASVAEAVADIERPIQILGLNTPATQEKLTTIADDLAAQGLTVQVIAVRASNGKTWIGFFVPSGLEGLAVNKAKDAGFTQAYVSEAFGREYLRNTGKSSPTPVPTTADGGNVQPVPFPGNGGGTAPTPGEYERVQQMDGYDLHGRNPYRKVTTTRNADDRNWVSTQPFNGDQYYVQTSVADDSFPLLAPPVAGSLVYFDPNTEGEDGVMGVYYTLVPCISPEEARQVVAELRQTGLCTDAWFNSDLTNKALSVVGRVGR